MRPGEDADVVVARRAGEVAPFRCNELAQMYADRQLVFRRERNDFKHLASRFDGLGPTLSSAVEHGRARPVLGPRSRVANARRTALRLTENRRGHQATEEFLRVCNGNSY